MPKILVYSDRFIVIAIDNATLEVPIKTLHF